MYGLLKSILGDVLLKLLEQYIHGDYFNFLLVVVISYFIVWGATFALTRPAFGMLKSGNPYIGICNIWLISFIVHTLIVVTFSIITINDMLEGDHSLTEFIIYNTGFFICFLVNIGLIYRISVIKSKIMF